MTRLLKPHSQKPIRERIVAEARSWIGTPFQHQQSMKLVGVDCVGIILGVGHELGLLEITEAEWKPFAAYSRQPNPARMRKAMRKFLDDSVVDPRSIPPIGTIGWFGWREDLPMHLAITAELDGRPTMIHAFEHQGRCVENTIDSVWLDRVDSWWQFHGVGE